MKIAFDMQPVFDNTKSGVGYHEDGLIRGLLKYFPENRYVFQYFSVRNREAKEKVAGRYEAAAEQSETDCCRWFPGSIYRLASSFFPVPHVLFFRKKADTTMFFNYYVPPFVRGKKVVIMHDMVVRAFPETVRPKTRIFLNLTIKKSIRRADRIVTDSEFSKSELMRFYRVSENKITVVPSGVDTERFHPDFTEEEKLAVKKKYGICTEQYFLFLGNVEPRKNIVRLIQAYKMYCSMEQVLPAELVVAGGSGWLNEEIFKEARLEESKGKVNFIGYVDEEDVPVLMAGAGVFCFPSIYEGFGMPPLEAMACGTPVIAGNASSLPEVVGGAGILVDPYSAAGIADAMKMLMNSKALQEKYRALGLERARKFTWKHAAEKLYEVYKEIC